MRRQLVCGLFAVLAGVAVSAAGVTGVQASPGISRSQGPAGAGPVALSSPGPGSQLWAARYGTTEYENTANAVKVSPDGGTVFVTGVRGAPSSLSYATAAYNAATGAQLWLATYTDPGNLNDVAASLAVSPSGGTVYVTGKSGGESGGVGSYDYATIAYNAATGAQLWIARYNGPGNGDDKASSVVVSPDGGTVFVTGESAQNASTFDYATVAYDATTGAQEWVARYHGPVTHYSQESRYQGPAYNAARSVAVSPSGRTVFVTGQDAGTTPAFDYATVAYDATTGAQEWVARYSASGGAEALAVSPDGGTVFVFGGSYVTVAYHG